MKKLFKKIMLVVLSIALTTLLFQKQLFKIYYPTPYGEIVKTAAAETQIPVNLLYAVIHTESHFNPKAESKLGAKGLMQITEDAFDWVKMRSGDEHSSYNDVYDPAVNINYGAKLLKLLLDEFGSYENAICAYHAGWGNVTNWLANENYSKDGANIAKIPFKDTAHYLHKVQKAWERYDKLYNEQ